MRNHFTLFLHLFTLFVFLLLSQSLFAKAPIVNFTIREQLFSKQKVHIVAQDTSGNDDAGINGRYTFVVNGFEKPMLFIAGKAEFPEELKNSTFLYMKWKGFEKPVPRLFFVFKSAAGIIPFKISLFWLLAIPIALVVLSFVFKRLIYLAIILVVLFFIFNKGLDVSNYFNAVKDWIASHL